MRRKRKSSKCEVLPSFCHFISAPNNFWRTNFLCHRLNPIPKGNEESVSHLIDELWRCPKSIVAIVLRKVHEKSSSILKVVNWAEGNLHRLTQHGYSFRTLLGWYCFNVNYYRQFCCWEWIYYRHCSRGGNLSKLMEHLIRNANYIKR